MQTYDAWIQSTRHVTQISQQEKCSGVIHMSNPPQAEIWTVESLGWCARKETANPSNSLDPHRMEFKQAPRDAPRDDVAQHLCLSLCWSLLVTAVCPQFTPTLPMIFINVLESVSVCVVRVCLEDDATAFVCVCMVQRRCVLLRT